VISSLSEIIYLCTFFFISCYEKIIENLRATLILARGKKVFSGIVEEKGKIVNFSKDQEKLTISILVSGKFCHNVSLGASISVDGTCLSLVEVKDYDRSHKVLMFHLINETLRKTKFSYISLDQFVNLERSLFFGKEVGGHILSGHINCIGEVEGVLNTYNDYVLKISYPSTWDKYILSKNYIAIDGISLTVVDKKCSIVEGRSFFTVHIIPDTKKRTTLSIRKKGDFVNLEFNSSLRAIVDTTENYLENFAKKTQANMTI